MDNRSQKIINTQQRQHAQLLLLDAVLPLLNTAAFAVCWYAYYEKWLYLTFEGYGDYMVIGFFCALYTVFVHLYGGFDLLTSRVSELIYSHVISLAMTGFFMFVVLWMLIRAHVPHILPLLLCLAVCAAFSALWSLIASRLTDKIVPAKKTVLIYDNKEAYKNGVQIAKTQRNRLEMVGEAEASRPMDALEAQLRDTGAEAVLLCGIASSRRNDILKYCIDHDILAYVRPNIGDLLISNGQNLRMNHLPVLLCQRAAPSVFYLGFKRLMDILISGAALILTSPFMLATAIAIKAYDGGPVMFTQKRMTLNRKEFVIHKFRSMKVDADKGGKGIVTMQNDDRITPVGKFIRACRLDELPQLYDIFIGNMTIVDHGRSGWRPSSCTKRTCRSSACACRSKQA